MAKEPEFLDWNQIEEEIAERNRAAWDGLDHEAIKRKAEEERQRAIRNGWMDEDGNSLLPAEPEEDEDEDQPAVPES